MEMAIGMLCISINMDLSALGRSNEIVAKKAMMGRNIILSRLNSKALTIFVYFLP